MAKRDSKWMQILTPNPLLRRNNQGSAPTALSNDELDKLLSDLCCHGRPVIAGATPEGQHGDVRRAKPELPERRDTRHGISDRNIQSIQIYLGALDGRAGRKGKSMWSHRPRIYAILRAINKVELIEDFIREGQNDFFLPWNERTLPDCLFRDEPTQVRVDFLRVQHFYLTEDSANIKAVEEEGGKHQNIGIGGDAFFAPYKELGQGGFGGVDAVQSTLSLRSFARKRVARGRHTAYNRQRQESIITELTNLQMLTKSKHKHLVTIVGSYTDPEYIAYLMLPVAERNLEQFLSMKMSVENKKTLRKFYGCLAGAVHHLHENKMRHRDLKPRNILISRNEVYISDFGSAIRWDRQSSTSGNTRHLNTPVTEEYMAPEISREEARGKPSDMWSLGAVYLEMTTRLLGRPVSDLKQRIKSVSKEKKTAPFYYDNLPAVTEWLKTLSSTEMEHDNEPISWTQHLMHRRPDDRPKSGELMKDIYESPSFSVFCCFKCHPDFQAESRGRDTFFKRADHREAPTSGETMDRVAKLLERPSANGLTAQKASRIDKWLTSSALQEVTGVSLTEVANSRWPVSDTEPKMEIPGEETDASEEFVDALEEQSQSSTQFTQLGKVREEVEVECSVTGMTDSSMLGDTGFKTPNLGWADEGSPESHLLVSLTRDDSETQCGTPKPADIATTPEGCVSYRNIRDSNLGFLEYDDESSGHELFDEYSDNSDLSSEEGQAECQQGHQPRGLHVDDVGQLEVTVLGKNGDPVFDEVSDISDDDLVTLQKQDGAAEVDILGPQPNVPQTAAEATQDGSVAESSGQNQIPLDVLPIPPQLDQALSETSTLVPRDEKSTDLSTDQDSVEVNEMRVAHRLDRTADPRREDTEDRGRQETESSLTTSMSAVLAFEPTLRSKEVTRVKTQAHAQLPKSALRSKSTPAGPRKSATFQMVTSEVAGEITDSAAKGVDVPKIEIHAAELGPAQLSKANIRTLGGELNANKNPRCPKKREPLLGVDAGKLMNDMAAEASTVPSSRMTERTKSKYDKLLLNMVPGEVDRQIIRACKEGKSPALRYLLEHDRGRGCVKRKHRGALIRAIRGASQNHNKCVESMIQAGVSVNMPNPKTGKTPLHVAIENPDFNGYPNLINLLADPAWGGADLNREDWNGDPPLVTIFSGSGSAPLEKHRLSALAVLLQQQNIDVNVSLPGSKNTPLHLAVRRQDHIAVAMLLCKNANVNAKNSAGTTPLQVAAKQFRGEMRPNHAVVLDLLLSHKARVDEPAGALRRTPLHWAVISGTAHAVELLLRYKADVTVRDANGLDAMVLAVKHAGVVTANNKRAKDDRLNDHVEIMQHLSEAAKCQWRTGQAKCPLQIAIEDGDVEQLEKLFDYGLDPSGPFLEGTIMDYAKKLGSVQVQAVIENRSRTVIYRPADKLSIEAWVSQLS